MFSGNACLFSEITDLENSRNWSLSWKLQKTKVADLPFFKQINTENSIAIFQCIHNFYETWTIFKGKSVCILLFIK